MSGAGALEARLLLAASSATPTPLSAHDVAAARRHCPDLLPARYHALVEDLGSHDGASVLETPDMLLTCARDLLSRPRALTTPPQRRTWIARYASGWHDEYAEALEALGELEPTPRDLPPISPDDRDLANMTFWSRHQATLQDVLDATPVLAVLDAFTPDLIHTARAGDPDALELAQSASRFADALADAVAAASEHDRG